MIAAALGLGAYHLRALLVPAWMGALARLAEVVIGLSMLILVSELLGVLGLFKEIPLRARLRRGRPRDDLLRAPARPAASAEDAGGPLERDHGRRSESRPRSSSSSTGPTRPARRSTRGCTTRTPPGTTCPSRPGSRRPGTSGRSTSPIRSSWRPGSTRRTPELLHGVGIVVARHRLPLAADQPDVGARSACSPPGASGGRTGSAASRCSAPRSSSTRT